jgi:hypothetical protein
MNSALRITLAAIAAISLLAIMKVAMEPKEGFAAISWMSRIVVCGLIFGKLSGIRAFQL